MDDHSEEPDLGTAGASARREHQRRRDNRDKRTREEHPRIGGALIALRDRPAHEQVWATGAEGEEATARVLAQRCPRALVLHDRRIPGRRANIDHIAVSPAGVLVIDSKRYKGKKVRVHNPLLGSAKLLIGGSDKTALVDGLLAQIEVVAARLSGTGVTVHGAFCFIDADLPLLGTPTIRGLPVLGPRGLAKRINCEGPLDDARIRAVAHRLAAALPAA